MITPPAVRLRYVQVEPYLEPLRVLVRSTLQPFVDENGFALVSRIKALESLAEKLESGRYKSWSEVDDLVAFAIVVPTLSDEAAAVDFLSSVFEKIELRARGATNKSPDVFRFDGTRFIGRMRSSTNAPRTGTEGIVFEVQVRSAFEHAWAVTTHALSYKTPDVSWEKLRVTAQLKAAVEQLDMIILGFEEAALKIEASKWPMVDAERRVAEGFAALVSGGKLPQVMAPKDWNRFSQNVLELVRASSWARRETPGDLAEIAIYAVKRELNILRNVGAPLSISLWQFTFACLCQVGVLAPPLNERWPLITPELEGFYPTVKTFADRIDLSI